MRTARLKSSSNKAWYHFTTRTSGFWDEVVFDDAARAKFVEILKEVASLSTVEVLDYAVMGNHVHLVARPGAVLKPERVADRYNRYYEKRFNANGEIDVDEDGDRAEEMAERLADCAYFVKMTLHRFTVWYNAHGSRRRAGRIWAQRYKTTIIDGETALWPLLQHLALNPLRVGEVEDPAEYAFSAYGEWMQTETHPFASTLKKAAKQMLPGFKGSADDVLDLLIDELVAVMDGEVPKAYEVDGSLMPNLVSADESRRFWTDAGAAGSERFVRRCISENQGDGKAKKQKLGYGVLPNGDVICSMRRLRFRPSHGDVRLDEAK